MILAPGQDGPFHPAGSPYHIKLVGEQTQGRLAVLESTFGPGEGAPLHRHQRHDETFYVVSGCFRLRCGDEVADVGPGGFMHVPRTVAHSFTSIGQPSTILVLLTPASFERFFIEAASVTASGRPDVEAMRGLLAKHDQELVEG